MPSFAALQPEGGFFSKIKWTTERWLLMANTVQGGAF
jgi:hypothetical protein